MALLDFLTGGKPRGIPEMKYKNEFGQALKMSQDRASGKVPSIAEQAGKRALQQGQANITSSMKGARGISPGMKAAMAARQGRKLQGEVAGQTSLAAAQERLAAEQGFAKNVLAGQGADMNREEMIRKQDESKRAGRAKLVSGIIQGGTGVGMANIKSGKGFFGG